MKNGARTMAEKVKVEVRVYNEALYSARWVWTANIYGMGVRSKHLAGCRGSYDKHRNAKAAARRWLAKLNLEAEFVE